MSGDNDKSKVNDQVKEIMVSKPALDNTDANLARTASKKTVDAVEDTRTNRSSGSLGFDKGMKVPAFELVDAESVIASRNEEEFDIPKQLKGLIDYGIVDYAKMRDDGSIVLKIVINAEKIKTMYESVHTPSSPAYKAILSITGPMSPGDLIAFDTKTTEDDDIADFLGPGSVAFGIESGSVEKVQATHGGGMKLWMIFDTESPSKIITFPPGAPHIEKILEYTGILEPGQEYVFEFNKRNQNSSDKSGL